MTICLKSMINHLSDHVRFARNNGITKKKTIRTPSHTKQKQKQKYTDITM